MRFLLLLQLLLCLSLFGCTNISKEERYVYQLEDQAANKISKISGLCLTGKGISWPEDIKQFILAFSSNRSVNIQGARSLFVEAVEEVLCVVNKDKTIRPHLYKYPFDENDIDLSIGFVNEKNGHIHPPNIAFVYIVRGVIYYAILNPENLQLNDIHSEPYQDALRIVRGESSGSQ